MHLDAARARWFFSDVRLLFRRTGEEFLDDHCPQLAAGIAYYVLFSIFPLAILAVSISGLVLTDASIKQDVVDKIFTALPLSEVQGRQDLENAVDGIATGLSAVGLISILGLLWSATAMMGGIRHALDEAWDTTYRRPFLRGKLLDLTLVMGVGLLIGASFAATIFLQVARNVSGGLSDALGPVGTGANAGFEIVAIVVPLLLSFLTFAALYKYVPSVRTHFRHVWPGALLAALLFELLKNGFALYLRYFSNYDAVYGSLGAVIIFLFFVYLSAVALLLGGEMAAEWPRVLHGHYDDDAARRAAQPSGPWYQRVRGTIAGLAASSEPAPVHVVDDDGVFEQRRRRRTGETTPPSETGENPPPSETDKTTPSSEIVESTQPVDEAPESPLPTLRPPSLADDPGDAPDLTEPPPD